MLHPGPAPLGDGFDFDDNSVVVRLDYGSVCFLLTGDAGPAVEGRLVAEGAWLECDVLKAARYGDASATTEPFLDAVDPRMVVIPAQEGVPYRQPDRETLERLEGREVYRTDQDGAVEVVSDGVGWVTR